MCNFAEDICYAQVHEATLKTAVHYSKSCEDFLEYQSVQDDLKGIKELLEKERVVPAKPASSEQLDDDDDPATQASEDATRVPDEWEELRVQVTKLPRDVSTSWADKAARIVGEYVRIVVWPSSSDSIVTEVQASSGAMEVGDDLGYVLIHADVKQRGEAVTMPNVRVCPLQPMVYGRQMQHILKARWRGAAGATNRPLNQCEVAVILDGGRDGNKRHTFGALSWTTRCCRRR